MKSTNPPTSTNFPEGEYAWYYDIPEGCTCMADIAETRHMNGNQYEMFKSTFCFGDTGRHSGTNYLRDLYKVRYYCNREIARLQRESDSQA